MKPTVKGAVLEYLEAESVSFVDQDVLAHIRRHVVGTVPRDRAPSDTYLLDILLSTDVEVDRGIGGIPSDLRRCIKLGSQAEARASLIDMADRYSTARDQTRAEDVRRAVIRAKDRLKLLLSRQLSPVKQAEKSEILNWTLVWLENPALFESWIEVRSRKAAKPSPKPGVP